MIQYIIVFAIVAIAGIYVVRKLIGQAKGKGCDNCECTCKVKEEKAESLTRAGRHE